MELRAGISLAAIEQWGFTSSSGTWANVLFPINFTNTIFYAGYSLVGTGTYHGVTEVTLNSMKICRTWYNQSSPIQTNAYFVVLGI